MNADATLHRLGAGRLTTTEEARHALEDWLKETNPEDPSAARRALRGVLCRFDPEAPTVREAFQETAAKMLAPWFASPEAARHVAFTIFEDPPRRNGSGPHDEGSVEDVEIITLHDLMQDPKLLAPPEEVLFPLGYREHTTLLSCREKGGKSTLVRGGIAAKTTGRPYMGRTPQAGDCLLFALEEHVGHVGRTLVDFGAFGPSVHIVRRLGQDRFQTVENAIRQTEADFVVIDTLAAFTMGLDVKSGDSSAWTAVVQPLTNIARDTGAGLCIVHHGRKEDGSYRDSTSIGAAVDMLLALSDGEVQGVKKITPLGRWEMRPLSFRIRPAAEDCPPVFELTSGDLSMDFKVFQFVRANPGATTRGIRDGVKGANEEKALATTRLVKGGYIQDRGGRRGNAFYATKTYTENP